MIPDGNNCLRGGCFRVSSVNMRFHLESRISQVSDSIRDSKWNRWGAPQQPFGGDVSILLPLHRSVLFALASYCGGLVLLRLPRDLTWRPKQTQRGYTGGLGDAHTTPSIHPSISATLRSASSRGGLANVGSEPLLSACLIHAATE